MAWMEGNQASPVGARGRRARTRRVVAALFCLLAIAAGPAWARKKKPAKQGPPPDLPGHVEYLARQLYGLHMDESAELTGEIQKLVLQDFQNFLPAHLYVHSDKAVPYDVTVRRELERIFAKVHYPIYALPAAFAQPWNGRMVVGVGYTLGWSDYDRANTLALFEEHDGKVNMTAVTNFVPRTDLHYEFPEVPDGNDLRFFVYGTRLGKSSPRLTVVLYSYDGSSLKPLWKTEDVYAGKLEVEKDQVTINYWKETEFIEASTHGTKPPRHQALYKLTPAGMQLVSDREIPY